jgi:hypothetical protein
MKSKETLGFVPLLGAITKDETNINDNSGAFASDEKQICDEEKNENSDNDGDFNNHSELSPSLGNSDTISRILTKFNFFIQRITSSSAKQSEYDVW